MADIFDEVSEELKQDQLVQMWKKYSKYIISFVLFVIILISSYQGYVIWNENKLNKSSEEFFKALENLENKEYLKSSEIFLKSSLEQSSSYKMLSLFGLAESNFKSGKIKEMISNYESIYENNNIDNYYKHLARILSVMKDDVSPFEDLHRRLKPILNNPSKLQMLAAEVEIGIFIRFNKLNKAVQSLKILLNRPDITYDQKNRLSLINKVYTSNVQ